MRLCALDREFAWRGARKEEAEEGKVDVAWSLQ
jgi:hypothetical protein